MDGPLPEQIECGEESLMWERIVLKRVRNVKIYGQNRRGVIPDGQLIIYISICVFLVTDSHIYT